MKNVLVLIHDDAGQEARLQAALDLTRALEGHLIALDVVYAPVMATDVLGVDMQLEILADARTRENEHCQRIKARLEREDVAWELVQTTGEIDDCLARNAGLADVIVVNRKLDDQLSPEMRGITSDVARKAHKLVVAVAENCPRFDAAGHAVVAWDGSQPSMSALTAAVPLLALAGSVNIVEIQSDGPGSVHEAATYLSRHGIHAEVSLVARFRDDGGSIAEMLDSICASEGAAYCVMGAYGHSPLREAFFGGTTRAMLGFSRVPLVLAH
jgi:nucleotide-binding universal stress UspA family protein